MELALKFLLPMELILQEFSKLVEIAKRFGLRTLVRYYN